MMKITALTVVSLLTKYNGVKAEDPCLQTFNVSSDSCSYEGLIASLQSALTDASCTHDASTELALLFGTTDESEIKGVIARSCAAGYVPFSEVTNEGGVFDKEYFDGGTYYNEQRESINPYGITSNELDADPGSRIKNIFRNVAQTNGLTFPEYITNFENCEYNTAMCCFVQDLQAGDNNGNCATPYDDNCVDANPADNTDICYVDMERSSTSSRTTDGFSLFEGEEEDDSHCHGFAWAEDPTDSSARFIGNNLFYVSLYDHMTQRGYVRSVPGAPMCGCVEQMPVVTRADCTEIEIASETVQFSFDDNVGELIADVTDLDINFNACQGANNNNNDLKSYVERLYDEGKIAEDKKTAVDEVVVGETYCREAIDKFLDEENLVAKPACRYGYPSECGCEDVNQKDYRGDISVTESGRECQRWDEQAPHSHSRTRANYPDSNLVENYCRNPDNEPGGAWCYTTDPDKRWEYCDVPRCGEFPTIAPTVSPTAETALQCSKDPLQKDFRGTLSQTRTGNSCQRWDSQSPHGHSRTVSNYPDSGLDENYCRNPDNEPGGAWCYTTNPDKRWEYCDVPRCEDGSSRRNRQLEETQRNRK